jgi:hypothetical protein
VCVGVGRIVAMQDAVKIDALDSRMRDVLMYLVLCLVYVELAKRGWLQLVTHA